MRSGTAPTWSGSPATSRGARSTGRDAVFDAFKRGRRPLMPRGMDREHVVALFEPAWELVDSVDLLALSASRQPLPIRKAEPTAYRLVRRG